MIVPYHMCKLGNYPEWWMLSFCENDCLRQHLLRYINLYLMSAYFESQKKTLFLWVGMWDVCTSFCLMSAFERECRWIIFENVFLTREKISFIKSYVKCKILFLLLENFYISYLVTGSNCMRVDIFSCQCSFHKKSE